MYIVALGAIIAGRAGTFNIGHEGQLLIGGTALRVRRCSVSAGLARLTLPLSLLLGALAGGVWAGIAAVLRYTRGVDVVISTLLLNFVALQVVSLAVNKAWLLQESTDQRSSSCRSPTSFLPSIRLPSFSGGEGTALSSSIFLARGPRRTGRAFALNRTRWGFQRAPARPQPHGRALRRRSGPPGSVAARWYCPGCSPGWPGACSSPARSSASSPDSRSRPATTVCSSRSISRRNAIVAIPWALFFGVLRSGGNFLSATGVPTYITGVVKGLVVLAALLPPVLLARVEAAAGRSDRP